MARPLRVGYFSGSHEIGGTERYLRELASSVDRCRFEPIILCRPELADFFAEGRGADIGQARFTAWEPRGRLLAGKRLVRTKALGTAHIPTAVDRLLPAVVPVLKQFAIEVDRRKLRSVLARQNLDLLHVHNGGHPGSPTALAGLLAGADVGIPSILTVHNMAKRRGLLARAESQLDHRVATYAAAVTTIGDAPARALAELRDFRQGSIRVIPTGVRVPQGAALRQEARERLGLREGPLTVGSIAAFTPVKGHGTLIAALARVRAQFPQVRAVLAGDGPCKSQIEEWSTAFGLAGAVVLPGLVDPFSTLAAFDVFVSASTTEGLPLSILEAMSQGVPVVATAVGAVPEAVIHGETGFLVRSGDVEDLARRLTEVLADPTLARKLGTAGRQRFDSYYRIDVMVTAYETLYDEVFRQRQ